MCGGEQRAVDLYSETLKFLKSHFLTNCTAAAEVKPENIVWVLVVPHLYRDTFEDFIRTAALQVLYNLQSSDNVILTTCLRKFT